MKAGLPRCTAEVKHMIKPDKRHVNEIQFRSPRVGDFVLCQTAQTFLQGHFLFFAKPTSEQRAACAGVGIVRGAAQH
jgi:hypothetical protein